MSEVRCQRLEVGSWKLRDTLLINSEGVGESFPAGTEYAIGVFCGGP